MRHPRMVWMRGEDRLEDRRRLELAGDPEAPAGDRAGRVGLEHLEEGLAPLRKPERMEQRHATLEPGLHLRVARGREAHRAELLRRSSHGLRWILVRPRLQRQAR